MGVLIRLALVLVLAGGACSPEIVRGTYFCGPERLCPPDLACDEVEYTCETPSLARAFTCPDESESFEPDGVRAQAHDLGSVACGQPPLDLAVGCVEDAGDDDLMTFEVTADLADACAGRDPHIAVTLRYPVAFVPLVLSLVSADGDAVAEAGPCGAGGDFGGMDALCIDAAPPVGTYFVEVTSAADGADCDGDCHYNRYALSIDFPLN